MNPIRCPKCGKTNDGSTYFCVYCGTIFEDYKKDSDEEIPTILTPENFEKAAKELKENNFKRNQFKPQTGENKHKLAIFLGYLFSILGGLLGLIIAIYLITRDDPNAKKHGKIQIGILAFWAIVLLLMLATGTINYNMLFAPLTQNMTNINSSMANNLSMFSI